MIKIIVLILALACTAVAQRPNRPKGRQLLADFRVDHVSNTGKIPRATERMVLSKVFRRYLTDENRCNPNSDFGEGDDPLEAARKAGQIVPSIIDMANGSFTAAGQTQTAYVISVSECNASHADNFGTKRVAIFSGQQLVADVDSDFMSSIVRKTDLNSDGINELLMTSGDMAQGTVTEMATLVSFQGGQRHVLHDFGTVVEDSCASEAPGSTSDISVLYISDAAAGSMPRITQENYRANCTRARRWRLISRGKRN